MWRWILAPVVLVAGTVPEGDEGKLAEVGDEDDGPLQGEAFAVGRVLDGEGRRPHLPLGGKRRANR